MQRQALDEHTQRIYVTDILSAARNHRNIYVAVSGAAAYGVFGRREEQSRRREKFFAAERIGGGLVDICHRLAQVAFLGVAV